MIDPSNYPNSLSQYSDYLDWKLELLSKENTWCSMSKIYRKKFAKAILTPAFERGYPLHKIEQMLQGVYKLPSNWHLRLFVMKYAPDLENDYLLWLQAQPKKTGFRGGDFGIGADKLSQILTKRGLRYDNCY